MERGRIVDQVEGGHWKGKHLEVPVHDVAKSFHEAEGKEVVPGERDRIVDQVEGGEGGQEWEVHLEVPVHDVAKSFHEADG